MRKTNNKPLRAAAVPTGAQAPASRLRTLFQTVRKALSRYVASETTSSPQELDLRYVKLCELERAAEPLLREWQGVKIAAMPLSWLPRYLEYPLPEKEVRLLTRIMLQDEVTSIAIPLDGGRAQGMPGKCSRSVIFAPDLVLLHLSNALCSCPNYTTRHRKMTPQTT